MPKGSDPLNIFQRLFNDAERLRKVSTTDEQRKIAGDLAAALDKVQPLWTAVPAFNPQRTPTPVRAPIVMTPADRGKAAYLSGKAGTDNPYPKDTHPIQHDEWIVAFNAEYSKSDKYKRQIQALTQESNDVS